MKKFTAILMALTLTVCFSACTKKSSTAESAAAAGKINVTTTIFPPYDFVRQIAKDRVNLKMLLPPGAESHSYEPAPQDIISIQNSRLFIYVGGDSDAWVTRILETLDKDNIKVVTLMDCVEIVEEEIVPGMQDDEEDEEEGGARQVEYDEHVWTSPRNAIMIVEKITDALCEIDPPNADFYRINESEYVKQLTELDREFKDVVNNAKRKEIIVGDRFPFRYFVDAYGLKYYAAFPGCSTETEASAATIAFLIDKVKKDKIPVVFHIELSNDKIANTIAEAAGAKVLELDAVHNLSKKDFESGKTYLDFMKGNVKTLKEALQ